MRSRIAGLLVVAAVVAACGGESADTTATSATNTTSTTTVAPTTTTSDGIATTSSTVPENPHTFEIVIEGTEVSGGGRITVPLGETVTLRFTSDVADEVHIHGYDLVVDLVAGGTVEESFVADIPGVVEIETHHGGLLLANLEAS